MKSRTKNSFLRDGMHDCEQKGTGQNVSDMTRASRSISSIVEEMESMSDKSEDAQK